MRMVKQSNGVLRGSEGSVPGSIQGQAGRGSEQPDPVEEVPAHCRVVELGDL